MSNSKLFFPDEAFATVRHLLPVSELREGRTGPDGIDRSIPVRVGPLEFIVVAKFLSSCEELGLCLKCQSVVGGFPWSGVVEAQFRILNRIGTKVAQEGGFCIIPVSSENLAHSQPFVLQPNHIKRKDTVFLEFLLGVKINVCLEEKEGESSLSYWPIPNSILNATPFPKTFLDPDSGDLEIVSKEGDIFSAHRALLICSSVVFNTMFSIEMSEKSEGLVNMGFGTKAVEILLKFLYTGSFKKEMEDLEEYDAENFLEVIDVGGMYELPLLMKLAGLALLFRTTRANVWDILPRVKKYGEAMMETLTSLADFVQDNVHAMVVE